MLSSKQCELARTMTQDKTTDLQINQEFESMKPSDKILSAAVVEKLLQLHDMPFDKGFKFLVNDFTHIASEFYISPATLFCVYMENKSKK